MEEQKKQGIFGFPFFTVVVVIGAFFVLCLFATIYLSFNPGKLSSSQLLNSFNLFKNWSSLVTNPRQEDSDLAIFDGIRVLAISWVILGHTFATAIDTPMINPEGIAKMIDKFYNAYIYNGTVSVDIFFFISSFLFTYVALKKSKGIPKVRLEIYIHRVIRFYPLILIALTVYCFVLPALNNGPLYYRIYEKANVYCGHIWYRVLLFFMNYRPWGYQCIDWVWYISLEFQLFLFTPFVLILYSRRKLYGILIPVGVILINIIATIIMAFQYDIWASIGRYNRDFEDIYYEKPYTRAGPYMIGILTGYFYYEYKTRTNRKIQAIMDFIKHSTLTRTACYIVGFGGFIMVIQAMYWLNKDAETLSRAADLVYLIFHRDVFVFCIFLFSLPVFAGEGKVLRLLLGNKFFFVLGKLSYGAYMTHQIFMEYYQYTKQMPIHFEFMHLAMQFLGYLFLAFFTAAVVFLFIELPIFNMESILLMPKRLIKAGPKNDEAEGKKLFALPSSSQPSP